MPYNLTIKEIEDLSYYDFMAYMNVPFFNFGGTSSVDRLAELCHITENMTILEVGCGTGANACYLAEKYGCRVTGVDVAEHMVSQAWKRAEELNLTDRISFKVGDAYHLDFPDNNFDAVITIFVSQFLDPTRAYPEFHRVLRGGGVLGVNEMYRADYVPPDAIERVNYGEGVFRELTELPFTLRSTSDWIKALESNGFNKIVSEEHSNIVEKPYALKMVDEFGGWLRLAGTIWRILFLALRSSKMRERFIKIGKGKNVLLRDDETNKYIGYILCVGNK